MTSNKYATTDTQLRSISLIDRKKVEELFHKIKTTKNMFFCLLSKDTSRHSTLLINRYRFQKLFQKKVIKKAFLSIS